MADRPDPADDTYLHQADDLGALLEASSLGSAGARSLRQRASSADVKLIQDIVRLRSELAHSPDSSDRLLTLAGLLERSGQLLDAEACYRAATYLSLTAVARLHEQLGSPATASQWRSRARTVGGPSQAPVDQDQTRSVEGPVTTSTSVRAKLVDLARKRADHDRLAAQAQGRQAKKNEEASSYRQRAAKATHATTARSYVQQAGRAEQTALVEGKKAADEARRSAECSKREADLTKELHAAVARESQADKRERDRQAAAAKRESDRLAAAAQRQLQSERARTSALVAASEDRLERAIHQPRPPQPEPLRVLYLTAASHGDLRVDEEIRRVKAGVRAATHRDLVQIEHKPAATGPDLLDGLTQFRPHVVHFSGHASATALVFDTGADGHNPGQRVSAAAFARAIAAVDQPPALVVLNACKSAGQLEGLLAAVPIAIGMADSVGDTDAMTFAARFYATIAEGQSVQGALDVSRGQMELNGLPDADLPMLEAAHGIDPRSVVLVLPPAPGDA